MAWAGANPRLDREAGFTLIEMIAVLVITALLATTIAYSARSNSSARVKALARQVAAGLRQTRGRAIKQGRETVAHIEIGNRRITWGTSRAPLSISRGITIKATTAASEGNGRTAGIRFFPNGSSTGGRLQLSSSGARYDISVNWLTGLVAVERGRR